MEYKTPTGEVSHHEVILPAIELGANVTTSSEFDPHCSKNRIMLNSIYREGGSAWCTGFNDHNQWIQVSFNFKLQKVVRIATQGRHDYDQWVKQYKIKYFDGFGWIDYDGSKIMDANSDRTTVVTHDVNITCYAMRIIPVSWHEHMSMRCEVYIAKVIKK